MKTIFNYCYLERWNSIFQGQRISTRQAWRNYRTMKYGNMPWTMTLPSAQKTKTFTIFPNARGYPPKVVWLTIGKCTNKQVIELLLKYTTAITEFSESNKSILLLP